MKKIFSFFATATVALFGLTCCGGGGGGSDDYSVMTLEDFQSGTKMLEILNEIVLYVIPEATGGNSDDSDATQVVVRGALQPGDGDKIHATFTYKQIPDSSTYHLTFSLYDPEDLEDKSLIAALGYPTTAQSSLLGTDADSSKQGVVESLSGMDTTLILDYASGTCLTSRTVEIVDPETSAVLGTYSKSVSTGTVRILPNAGIF